MRWVSVWLAVSIHFRRFGVAFFSVIGLESCIKAAKSLICLIASYVDASMCTKVFGSDPFGRASRGLTQTNSTISCHND